MKINKEINKINKKTIVELKCEFCEHTSIVSYDSVCDWTFRNTTLPKIKCYQCGNETNGDNQCSVEN